MHLADLVVLLALALAEGVVPVDDLKYADEWLTVEAVTCSEKRLTNIGVAKNPIANSTVDNADACCTFAQQQKGGLAWTFHNENGKCFVSSSFSPHPAKGAISNADSFPPARTASTPATPAPLPPVAPPLGYQPNIVFILTDDQDRTLGNGTDTYTTLGSLEAMPKAQKRMLEGGAWMEHFYVNTPICCPSRTEFFTGRYYHNVGPPNHAGHCMHVDTTMATSNKTGLFGLMKRAGYNTGVFGKVTNDQGSALEHAVSESSMTYIDSPLDYNDYDGLTWYRHFPNGTTLTETVDKTDPIFGSVYQTSQIGNRTMRWLGDAIDTQHHAKRTGAPRVPFFAYLGPHAPHFPAEPAPWYNHTWTTDEELSIPNTPNYNCANANKSEHVAQNAALNAGVKCWENVHMRDRWMTLLSVDDLVEDVFAMLEAKGVMGETFVFYSSDHGYKQGQWRIGTSKQHPYETDIRVPLMVVGPGIQAGSNHSQVAGNVDVMPTILDLAAGPEWAASCDGHSLRPILTGAAAPNWRDHFINEYKSVGTYYNDHSGIWNDGTSEARCGGVNPKGPNSPSKKDCVEGNGKCYFVDSTASNSWRQLRVVNATHNINYIEYDPSFEFNVTDPNGFGGLQHYELYDIAADPYQMNSIYAAADEVTKHALHAQLETYFQCEGASCP